MTEIKDVQFSDEHIISVGKYVIINRKKFSKLLLLTDNSTVFVGKDKIDLSVIIGKPFWSTFKMIPKKSKREFSLALCNSSEINECSESLKYNTSGQDNRNIWDDGNSQSLSTQEIIDLRESGLSSQAIVERLIENSKTFHNKTEYSQEKYLKKKGTKYFEYVTIKRPTIRLLSELFFSKDPTKVLGLRTDSLSQIITAINLQPDGRYVLYENGSQGLVAATILNHLSEDGRLIYITPGKHAQKHAILAMNFNEKINQMKCIQLSALLDRGDSTKIDKNCLSEPVLNETESVDCEKGKECSLDATSGKNDCIVNEDTDHIMCEDESLLACSNSQKRKNNECLDDGSSDPKKPRWELDADEAVTMLNSKNNDGLVIVCKEYPLNLLLKCLQYVGPSRPFVVFSLYRETLSQLYVELKLKHNIINLRLTETWLRSYQVLPDRTHPDVVMSGNSGYLLTGIIVNNL